MERNAPWASEVGSRARPFLGVLTATAMVACVGDIHRFRSGRHFASWLRTDQPDALRAWAKEVALRHCHNVAVVALANTLARICWRTWRDGRDFERREPCREGLITDC